MRRADPGFACGRAALLVALPLVAVAACGGERFEERSPAGRELRTIRDAREKMGTRFEIQLVTDDERAGRAAIEAAYGEIDRLEALLSEWRETSEISEVNRRAGETAVRVGDDLLRVVERSLEISELTDGAFDITFRGCGRLWSFRERRIPAAEEIAACLPRVGYRKIALDTAGSTVGLRDAGARIGIAGIGKGYGIDRAAALLERHGSTRYLVDGGGDLRVRGSNVGRSWSVGIAHPRRPGELYARISVDGGAIVTSGDYYQYFERDGTRYHHVLDPRTAMPARGAVAVTVTAPEAMDADALATGLMVLGPDRGLALVESLPGVEALILDAGLAEHGSSGFPDLEH